VQVGGSRTQTINAEELAVELDNSQSSVIYVDVPDAEDEAEAEPEAVAEPQIIAGETPLHVEFDQVRQKLAVRRATEQEVEAAEAGQTSGAGDSSPVPGVRSSAEDGPDTAGGAEGRGAKPTPAEEAARAAERVERRAQH
jgi:hypothetical protein